MGSKKNVAVSGVDEVKVVETPVAAATDSQETAENTTKKEIKVAKKTRSKKYASSRSQVDKTRRYPLTEAVELVKKLSYTKFEGTVEAHLVVKDAGISADLALPHSTGKSVKVAIVSPDVIKEIEAGKIDFDVLLATPQDMPKITKFARTLGPKGLMPNPKSGTLTPNPEGKKKELEAGKMTVKAERKAPLVHLGVGKTDMKTEELVANIEALLKAFKGKVVKLSLAATMSPSVRVELEK